MSIVRLLPAALFLVALGCGTDEDGNACTTDEFSCQDNILVVCNDQGEFVEEEDCDAAGDDLECHAEMGHCMNMSM